jgi:hypothetical protein
MCASRLPYVAGPYIRQVRAVRDAAVNGIEEKIIQGVNGSRRQTAISSAFSALGRRK